VVDGGGLENVPDRLYQDGYILGAASMLQSPESGQKSRDLTVFDTTPDNRSVVPLEI
jgi:hypothetical protein